MPKLSQYVAMATTQYLQETGRIELDAHWLAEFFQDAGVADDYPRQDLVAFHAMVQKALTERAERADKQTRFHLAKIIGRSRAPRRR